MLILRKVTFRFPEATIRADFCAERGATIGLMGPSGSGKTTILNLLAGFLSPESGDIQFDQKSLLKLQPAQRPLSYLFQSNNLFPHLTVWQNLAIGIKPTLKLSSSEQEQIVSVLERVSLPGFAERYPGELSGGQQQRIGLARCLLRNKPILLLDEPFSALDQALRSEISELIFELQQELSLIIVLSTHQENDVRALNGSIVNLADYKQDFN